MKAKIVQATTEMRVQLGEVLPLNVPFTLEIFPTNCCNFKCVYCTQSVKPCHIKNEYMDFGIYEKCISDATAFPQKIKLLLIAGLGEPLLHPEIVRMVKVAKQAKVAETVRIITNASLLTKEISDGLIDAELDHLKISIQGLSTETYIKMCGVKISFQKIVENIRYFYEHKKNTVVNVKIIDEAFESNSDRLKLYEIFGEICDEINIEFIAPYQENVNYEKLGIKKDAFQIRQCQKINKICQFPFYFYSVYPDGEIIPCCMLLFERYKELSLGNIKDNNLFRIWNSKQFNEFRIKQLEAKRNEFQACDKCTVFINGSQRGDNIDDFKEKLLEAYNKIL